MFKTIIFYSVLCIVLYFINKQLDNFYQMMLIDLAITVPSVTIKKKLEQRSEN